MPDLNKANRMVCDVMIDVLKTGKEFLFFDTANVTTVGLTGDSVYAMAKGARAIAFQNPMEGTLTIEAQVYPFKLFALYSDGVIETEGAYKDVKTIKCETAGELAVEVKNGEIQAGTVVVFPVGEYGNEEAAIEGTFADGKFTATSADALAVGTEYQMTFMVTRTGIKKVSFNNDKVSPDYKITMKTLDKDEDGLWTPFLITAHKATIQRNFELSFSSEGDPVQLSATFDILQRKGENILEIIELPDDAE